MLLPDLINSTEKLENSFAGVLQKGSIEQWNQGLYDRGTQGVEHPTAQLRFGYFATESPEEIRQRLFCHILVSLMPSQGLPELHDSIADLVRFYWQPVRPENVGKYLPTWIPINKKVTDVAVRPDFPIVLDDE